MKSNHRAALDAITHDVRALFDVLPTPVHFFLDDNSIVWANRAMDEFLGYEPGGVAKLQTTDIYFGYAKDTHHDLVEDFVRAGQTQGRLMVSRKDGTLISIPFHSTANVLPGIHLASWWPEFNAILNHDHFDWPSVPIDQKPPLTTREIQVVSLISDGAGNSQIAMALGIAEATVQQYADSARLKLDAANRSEMVSNALSTRSIKSKLSGHYLIVLAKEAGETDSEHHRVVYVSSSAVANDPGLARLVNQVIAFAGLEDSDPGADPTGVRVPSLVRVDGAGLGHLEGPAFAGGLRESHVHIRDFGLGLTVLTVVPR